MKIWSLMYLHSQSKRVICSVRRKGPQYSMGYIGHIICSVNRNGSYVLAEQNGHIVE